ncbi:uncharacterized protein KGF55_002535 [Candida pseudojiufengensis]|uniref:uncharacterized protein n=1 Tax=Candida pseudojiufengensis TaxID=497109 RepID=UPI0022240EB6|nr:uncharacterized protein KGF55_002535 [Candida pseudojiufengensis]KAI5963655.1 hypothetical protein KGF55_002535 [Candida pseudojiufengensis]
MAQEDYDALKYRKWIKLNQSSNNNDSNISIMTYNLLSRHYIWKHVYDQNNPKHLDWAKHRFPLINQTIRQLKCDIMCFQEMEYYVYKRFWSKKFPNDKFKSFYIQKSSAQFIPTDLTDGVGIFINTERFDILDEIKINYGQEILKNQNKYSLTNDLISRVIPRNTVGLILKLYDKKFNKILYVSNTHLYWSPKFNDVKVLQTKLLLNKLESSRKELDSTVIFLGDLNSNYDSDVVKLLRDGQLDSTTSKEFKNHKYGLNNELMDSNGIVQNPFSLRDVYETLFDNCKLHFTSFVSRFSDVVDHIFVSDDIEIRQVLGEVDPNYCASKNGKGFPDGQFPSDHIPLVAEINYKSI